MSDALPGMPASIHAEVAILGAMMLDPAAIADATSRLEVDDFSLDSHRRVYRALLALVEGGGPAADTTLVRAELERRHELEAIGGVNYLFYLTEGIPRNLNVDSYVRIVKDKSLLRQMMAIFNDGSNRAADQSDEAIAVLREIESRLRNIADQVIGDSELQSVGQFLDSRANSSTETPLAAKKGIRIGFTQFDEVTGGLQRRSLVVVAAIASAGKTAFACNVAYNTAVLGGYNVAFFPLEDQNDIAVRRVVSGSSRVDYQLIRSGSLKPSDQYLVDEHTERLHDAPLYLDDTFDVTMSRIREKCSRLKRRLEAEDKTLDLIIIDQLSHVSQGDIEPKLRGDEKLGKQAHMSKLLAEEMDAAVMLMCQLTQESGKRTNPRPTLFDLAGSGQIKNYARVVAFLHRPEMWDKDNSALVGKGEIIIAKNNEGPTKTCDVLYSGRCLRWEDETQPNASQDSFHDRSW